MSDYYMNNPMMDILKKAMENPASLMSMWTKNLDMMKNFDMLKNFNASSWTDMMPWLNPNKAGFSNSTGPMGSAFNFADNIKNTEMFSDTHKLSLDNAQAVLRRQAEIIQKHTEELGKLMQQAISSRDPAETMKHQSDYMRSTFDVLVADFKELTEMYAKAGMETFEVASKKLKCQMDKMAMQAGHTSACSASAQEEKAPTKKQK